MTATPDPRPTVPGTRWGGPVPVLTVTAEQLVADIAAAHPEVVVHLAGTSCGDEDPTCLPPAWVPLDAVPLGRLACGIEVTASPAWCAAMAGRQVTIDAIPGRSHGFGLEGGSGRRLVLGAWVTQALPE